MCMRVREYVYHVVPIRMYIFNLRNYKAPLIYSYPGGFSDTNYPLYRSIISPPYVGGGVWGSTYLPTSVEVGYKNSYRRINNRKPNHDVLLYVTIYAIYHYTMSLVRNSLITASTWSGEMMPCRNNCMTPIQYSQSFTMI